MGSPDADLYLRRVDLATEKVTKLEGSDGLWAPKCARDGRILAQDLLGGRPSPADGPTSEAPPPGRAFFKVRDPRTGSWSPLTIDVPDPPNDIGWPTWSRDSRFIYATRMLKRLVVRFDLATKRLETVFNVEGLGEPGTWVEVDPAGAVLLHREASQNEIFAMEWHGG
jgi:hypothetical protein